MAKELPELQQCWMVGSISVCTKIRCPFRVGQHRAKILIIFCSLLRMYNGEERSKKLITRPKYTRNSLPQKLQHVSAFSKPLAIIAVL
jgi:hypothetical protein